MISVCSSVFTATSIKSPDIVLVNLITLFTCGTDDYSSVEVKGVPVFLEHSRKQGGVHFLITGSHHHLDARTGSCARFTSRNSRTENCLQSVVPNISMRLTAGSCAGSTSKSTCLPPHERFEEWVVQTYGRALPLCSARKILALRTRKLQGCLSCGARWPVWCPAPMWSCIQCQERKRGGRSGH